MGQDAHDHGYRNGIPIVNLFRTHYTSSMLKKTASGVPRLAETAVRGRSHRSPRKVGEAGSEAQRTEAYASPLRSLRPCWTAFLSILKLVVREHRTDHSSHIVGSNRVFQQSPWARTHNEFTTRPYRCVHSDRLTSTHDLVPEGESTYASC